MAYIIEASITIRCNVAPPRPGRVFLASKRETEMAKFGLKFGLPPAGASDVTQGGSRELSITVGGQDVPQVVTLPGAAMETDELTFESDAVLSLTLVDIDKSGNRSQPSAIFNYTVVDDVAPPQPGQLSVAAKRQLPDEAPTPTPGT
jgi:hypothetical protein